MATMAAMAAMTPLVGAAFLVMAVTVTLVVVLGTRAVVLKPKQLGNLALARTVFPPRRMFTRAPVAVAGG
jgi:hypothetical protein